VAKVTGFLAAELGERPGADKISRFLASCADRRLMASEEDRYLSLAIPANAGC
jgi:hypothetical protein